MKGERRLPLGLRPPKTRKAERGEKVRAGSGSEDTAGSGSRGWRRDGGSRSGFSQAGEVIRVKERKGKKIKKNRERVGLTRARVGSKRVSGLKV